MLFFQFHQERFHFLKAMNDPLHTFPAIAIFVLTGKNELRVNVKKQQHVFIRANCLYAGYRIGWYHQPFTAYPVGYFLSQGFVHYRLFFFASIDLPKSFNSTLKS